MVSTRCFLFCTIGLMSLSYELSAYKDLDWWETTLMYQIYPRSFKDSNGDGVGDFNGIHEKLDYLKDLGVGTIWIQPFYKSPNADMGYDISDFRAIDPVFGTMEDFKRLVEGIHEKGMKVILDYVPNHTSDEHEWFKLSENRVEPYTDYFIWKDPKPDSTQPAYPNNWLSVFGGSAWAWSEKRKQYYYHAFAEKQPDLNYRNPRVRQEMIDVLKYWLDLKVDGFRVDAILWLLEDPSFADEPPRAGDHPREAWRYLEHPYTFIQPDNAQVSHEWRLALDEYKRKDGQTRLLSIEAINRPNILVTYLGNSSYPNVHVPYYFAFNFLDFSANASMIHHYVQDWIDLLPKENLPNWVFDSHDVPRTATRVSPEGVDMYTMLMLLLPGLACVYYGTEIGIEESHVRTDQRQDAGLQVLTGQPRDACRGPMLWDDTKNAGFTTGSAPWLPVQTNYWRTNVKRQEEEPNSHLRIFKRLSAMRKTSLIKHGRLNSYVLSDWVYMFTRSLENEKIAVVLNFGSETKQICAKDTDPSLPDTMFVHTSSVNSGFQIGDKVRVSDSGEESCAELRPHASLVLSVNSVSICSLSSYLAMLAVGFSLFWRSNFY